MADYPLPKFHFSVDWGGANVGFSEISGLNVETELIEYRHGASPEYHKLKMPGMQKYENIVLKRGSFNGDNQFFEWWNTVQLNKIEKRDITIKLLNENLVDGAILDVRIPGVDGFGVCEYIRDNDLKIPVFMLTGSSDGVVRNFLGKLTTTVGGDYFVTKPYDGKALALMLRRALEKPQRDA